MTEKKGNFLVRVTWTTRDGPMATEKVYREVRKCEYQEGGHRLLLHFDHSILWLFTQHMASVEVEESA